MILNENERLDDLQNGSYVIQNKNGFCFGIDAVLLAHFPEIRKKDKVLDMGCGCGVIPIIMSLEDNEAHFTGIEIQTEQADLARRSVEYNSLQNRIDIVNGDIKEAVSLFGEASFSLITCNPPYKKLNSGKESPNQAIAIAKHEVKITLSEIIESAAKLLRPKGRFAMIHRPARLPEIITLLKENRLEPKRICMIHSAKEKEATMVLIESVLGGNPELKVESPVIVYGDDGDYTDRIYEIYGKQKEESEKDEIKENKEGMLYLCATPIGNLEDMTYRAVKVLSEADLIAAEDTRTSRKLLDRYGIKTKTTSYHKFNENEKSEELIGKLLEGLDIVLISDAGTPAISDPGEILVKKCIENDIKVTAIPGASAAITALSLSGKDTRRFVFEGFLPMDKKEQKKVLGSLKKEERTIIFYEAPHRIEKTLNIILEELGNRNITLCRELTKKFETVTSTDIESALGSFETEKPRGEYVLIIEGRSGEEILKEEASRWEGVSLSDHVKFYESSGHDKKEAMKLAAKDLGISKREVYNSLNKK